METSSEFGTPSGKSSFDPLAAFSRSLGWLTEVEQKKLKDARVGIIGMGGVGGQYAEILARLGIGNFIICDPDKFAIENTNRQNECKTSNYGRSKSEVIRELILDINPTARVTVIPGAMQENQVDEFCRSIDVYLDALDFFELDLRISIFQKMHQLGRPAVTIAPVGMGAAQLVFQKGSMSFDDYFGFHRSKDETERAIMFLVGLTPSFQHAGYIQDRTRLDFANHKTPSLPIGVYACAAAMATMVTKIILGRGKIQAAPWSVHYDAYNMKIVKKYVWLGYRNPLQKIKMTILRKSLPKPRG